MRQYYSPIFVALCAALLCAAALGAMRTEPAVAGGRLPADWQKGAVMLNFGPDPYRPSSAEALDSLVAAGANWVAISPIWYMDTRTSNTIYPDVGRASPDDASVLRVIGWAKERGLKVMLKPYFDVKDLTWRAEIAPTDPEAWWTSYRRFIFHYADIAARAGVDELTIGTELISMTRSRYNARWLALIGDLRARYGGWLTYSANWGKSNGEYQTITWWDKLDFIGISAYFPISLKHNPPLDELVRGWTSFADAYGQTYNWVEDIAAVHRRYGRPVIFTEIGFGSYSNTSGRWDVTESEIVDHEAQRRAYEATFIVWSQQPWFKGIYWWYWDTDPRAGVEDRGQTPRHKPAQQVLADWYGGSYAPPPAPTATPIPAPPPTPILPTDAPEGGRPASPSPYAGHPAFEPVEPFVDGGQRIYFPATGHSLSGEFLKYWQERGGLELFGYPISEPFEEVSPTDGKTYLVQWFERNRFELHPELPESHRVSLGLLGVQVTQGRADAPFTPATPLPGKRFSSETGHSLGGGFLDVWERFGGLPIFGYPISEEFAEKSSTDGKVYIVQYFERARFEYHPEHLGTTQAVQLGLLGRIVTGR